MGSASIVRNLQTKDACRDLFRAGPAEFDPVPGAVFAIRQSETREVTRLLCSTRQGIRKEVRQFQTEPSFRVDSIRALFDQLELTATNRSHRPKCVRLKINAKLSIPLVIQVRDLRRDLTARMKNSQQEGIEEGSRLSDKLNRSCWIESRFPRELFAESWQNPFGNWILADRYWGSDSTRSY